MEQPAAYHPLLTDLYELTMAQCYFECGKLEPATFSLFVRSYPPDRGYFVAAGLEDVLRFLESLAFDEEALGYLRSLGLFRDSFLNFLRELRFTGEVWAVPEGRLFFKEEPVLEITAPIIEAQIVETFVINQINFQSLIATKAARCFHAAAGKSLVDFSLRRTHGTDAGLKVARASYIAGFSATSNLLAGSRYGIPVAGTMAHSFVSSFEHESEAFRSFAASFPENAILLIDTYDPIAGARKAVEVARELKSRGLTLKGVRIDSGDLASLAREVRRVLDEAGLQEVKIIGSGGLDEYDLEDLARAGAPYDSYGIGTKMGVSGDAPWFDTAYKLVEHNGRPVLKLSTGKVSLPGKKQVFRFATGGKLCGDTIALRGERLAGGEPLLEKVMEGGKILRPLPPLGEIRERFLREWERLPEPVKAIRNPPIYPVSLSARLAELRERVARQLGEREGRAAAGGRR